MLFDSVALKDRFLEHKWRGDDYDIDKNFETRKLVFLFFALHSRLNGFV